MKRTPRHITIEVGGVEEKFLLSTYVSRVFTREKGSDTPDGVSGAFKSNPLESIIRLAEISYNNYPGNDKLTGLEFCTLLDEMDEETIEAPYEVVLIESYRS